MTTKKKASKEKNPSVTSPPAMRPVVAGIDIGSSQHWVCGPAQEGEEPKFGSLERRLPS
jgi:hypothetical protein